MINSRFRSLLRGLFVLSFSLLSFLFVHPAYAAVKTWDNTSGDGLWSTCTNWDTDTCPGATDVATFNGTSNTASSITFAFDGSVAGIDVQAGYTNTITNNRPGGLTIGATGISVASGTLNLGSSAIDLNGPLAITGGTFYSTSGTMNVNGAWTHSAGGTFENNTGTVIWDGNSNNWTCATAIATSCAFYNFTINSTSANAMHVFADPIKVANNLTLTDGDWDTGHIQASGNVTAASTYGTGVRTGTLYFIGNTAQTFDLTGAAAIVGHSLEIDTSGSVNLLSDYSMTYSSNTVTLTAGTFNISNFTLTTGTSNGFTQAGGSFTGTSGTIDSNGTFAINVGTFNAPSGNFTIDTGIAIGAGVTFNHNNGTVTFDAGGDVDYNVDSSATFYNVTLNKTNNYDQLTMNSDTMVVEGTLTFTKGKPMSGVFQAQGDVTITSGYSTASTATLVFSGSNTQSFNLTGATNVMNTDITVSKSGGRVNLASDLTLDAASQDLTVSTGTFDINGKILTVSGAGGTFVVGNGGTLALQGGETPSTPTFNAGSTAEYDGTVGPYTIANWSYKSLSIVGGASAVFSLPGTKNVGENLTVTSGTLDAADQGMDISGNTLINGGTLMTGTGTITFGDAVGDSVTISSGELQIESTATNTAIVINAGTWTNSGGAVTYMSATPQSTQVLSAISPYYDLEIDSSGSTYVLNGAIVVSHDLTLTAGTLDASASNYTVTVARNWSKTSGTFNAQAGTVIFNDAAQQSTISGDNTFYNLTVITPSKTMKLTSGTTQTVGGLLTLTGGGVGTEVVLQPTTTAVWYLNVSGTSSVDYVSVSYSDASGGNAITHAVNPSRSIDGGNNTNWGFNVAPTVASITGTQGADGTGTVTITFIMDDADDDDTLQAKIEYSNDGGSTWADPTLSTAGADTSASYGDPSVDNAQTYQVGQAGAYITSSSGANTVTIVWQSATDEPIANIANAQIRVTPYDGTEAGTADTSANFILDNTDPSTPGSFANTVAGSSTATFTWTISTETNFNHYELWYGTTQLDVQNRTGTASEWDNAPDDATLATRTTTTTSLTGLTTGNTYYILMCAQDNYGNEACTSDISFATNTVPTVTSITAVQDTDGTGNITITFIMDDADDDDTLQAKIEYSINGGLAWNDPTLSTKDSATSATYGDPSIDNAQTYQVGQSGAYITSSSGANTVTIVWGSAADVPVGTDISNAQIKVTPYDGTGAGTPDTSANFILDLVDPTGLASFTYSSYDVASVDLSWTAASDSNFNHYEVWYGSTEADVQNQTGTATEWDNSDDAALTTVSTATTTITSDPRNKYFKIWAMDDYGNGATVADFFLSSSTPRSSESIGVPTGLTVVNTGTGVLLTWEDPSSDNSKYIEILRGISPLPVSGTSIASVAIGQEFYIDSNVADGQVITYMIRAKGNTKTGDLTSAVSVTVDLSTADDTPTTSGGGGGGGGSASDGADSEDLPDLVVSDMSLSYDTITYSIANTGAALSSPYQIFTYVYVNDELKKAVKISDISKSYTTSPFSGENGDVSVKICTDVTGSVVESDEANNCLTEEFYIEIVQVDSETLLGNLGIDVPDHWSKNYLKNLFDDQRVVQEATSTASFTDLLINMFSNPNEGMNRGEALQFLLVLADYTITDSAGQSFTDVGPAYVRASFINFAAEHGLVQGYPDGTFRPEDTVNRAEALKMAAYFFGLTVQDDLSGAELLNAYELSNNPFTDVDINAWYAPYVIFAYSSGVVGGYGDGTFGPDNDVTFAEFLKIATLMKDVENAVELASEFE